MATGRPTSAAALRQESPEAMAPKIAVCARDVRVLDAAGAAGGRAWLAQRIPPHRLGRAHAALHRLQSLRLVMPRRAPASPGQPCRTRPAPRRENAHPRLSRGFATEAPLPRTSTEALPPLRVRPMRDRRGGRRRAHLPRTSPPPRVGEARRRTPGARTRASGLSSRVRWLCRPRRCVQRTAVAALTPSPRGHLPARQARLEPAPSRWSVPDLWQFRIHVFAGH